MAEILEALLLLVFLALAVSVFAIFVAKSLMLESFRRRVERARPWAGYLLRCPFCQMGWTSIVLTLVYRPELLADTFDSNIFLLGPALDYCTSLFVLWGLMTLSYRIVWPFLERNAPKLRLESKGRKQK